MKLVDILARELEEWPSDECETHAAVVDYRGDYVIQFTKGGAPAWVGHSYTILGHGCGPDVYWRDEDPIGARGLKPAQENMCSREEWQAARAAYLASIQPERDAEIARIVESALQTQQGGTHYKDLKIQPIEYIHANGLDFFQGNIVKYATRHKDKNGAEDLRKVIHYAQLALELQYGEKNK